MRNILIRSIVLGALLVAHPHFISAQTFVHPGGLVTQDDIDRIQYLLNMEGDATIKAAFNKLKVNSHAQYTYKPNAQAYVKRGGDGSDNYSIAMNDVAAAYQNALMWRITEDARYADCAVRILNAWAKTCKDIMGDTNASLASGIYGYEFAQAGELLRGYKGWDPADFKAYQDWMRHLWYPRAMYFIVNRHGRTCATNEGGAYFSNWGLCNLLAIMSIGILCDDVSIYNQGLSFYKDDKCGNFTDVPRNPIKDIGNNEFLGNLVVWLHPDPRGPFGYLGQMQESGRDQGHATMAAGLAVDICQTAWNQGDDLYAYMDNRIAAGFEYIALVNSLDASTQVNDSVPFIPYERKGLPTESYTAAQNGLGGWGSGRPYWDRVVAHYEGVKGIPMRYSVKMRDKVGVDGGGGDYGGNSGGYDHLGFSTLTSYRPVSLYPMKGHTPLTLGTRITYNGNTTVDNRINEVQKGSVVTLSPFLPEGVAEDGNWKWETGETTRELTLSAEKSGIYRVIYTSANGTRSIQAFNVAVWGDCTPDIVKPKITVGETTYQDTVISVLPFQKFSLSISTAMYSRGYAVWSTGNTGFNLTVNSIHKDSVFRVEHYNEGGYKTSINFHVKLQYVTPSISVDGGNAVTSNNVAVNPGQNVELKPVTTSGYDGGTFRWSTGHASKNLMMLNIQKAKKLQCYYTLIKNNVTTTDTLDFSISVSKADYQMTDGDYYILKASGDGYLTNTNADPLTKVKPSFMPKNATDSLAQIWTITKETTSDANGRFRIVSKKDGNYINEKGTFGTNAYYPSWNTYTFHALDGENLFSVQNGGSAGTKFWAISGDEIAEGTTALNGYPFMIKSVIPQKEDTTTVPGSNVISYITPAYSINGGASKRGDRISLAPGKGLVLKPIKVTGLNGGTWLWSDNSTESTLDLGTVQNGGVYSVSFTYPEGNMIYVFSCTYTVSLAEDNYAMPSGDYRIRCVSDGSYLTNNGTLKPAFAVLARDSLSQLWTVALDNTTSRYKIVSCKDGRFLEEHGAFNNSSYSPIWNTYLFHYKDEGEKQFAIQNAGSAGTSYWGINNNTINSGYAEREYPFVFELVNPDPSGINEIVSFEAVAYLNWTGDAINVEMDTDGIFRLYSINGSIVNSMECAVGTNVLDISHLPDGTYLGIVQVKDCYKQFKIQKR